jgi:nitric oxide dioxygenase
MPSGEFVYKEKENPIVFISGGIGITPLISMFKEANKKSNQEILFIQCALHSGTHAFAKEVKELELLGKNTKTITVYSSPLEQDVLGVNHEYQGFLTAEILKQLKVSKESDFYFCGPTPFMANLLQILEDLKVSSENIHYEFFGPKEELRVAETVV